MPEIPIAFDWWRCGGRMIKAPAIPPPPFLVQPQIPPIPPHPQQQHPCHQQQQQFQQPPPQIQNPTSAAIPVKYRQSAPHGDNTWPIHKIHDESDDSATKDSKDLYDMGCQVSRDYWHEPYKFKKCSRICTEGPRPAWCPAKIPTDYTGLVLYPPPYSRYCRKQDKLSCYICQQ